MVYIVIVFILLILIYKYVILNNNHWKDKSVIYETPTFLFGSFKEVILGSKHFGIKYAELYSKFKNIPYVGFFRFRTPAIVLRDPALIKTVLVKDYSFFEKNDFEVDSSLDPILKTNIFMQSGEEWKKNRSAWTSGLTTNKLKVMFDVLTDKADVMINHLKKHVKNKPDEPLETKDISSNFFIDVVVTSVFGLKISSFELKDNPFKKIANMFFTPSMKDNLISLLFLVAPQIPKFLKLKLVSGKLEKELISLAKGILEIRQKSGFDKSNSFDVILQAENKNKQRLEIESGGLVLNFLIDGTETSAIVSGFLLYALAKNPHVQKKLRDEIMSHAELHNGIINYENINEIPYLDMVLTETLRLYPPALALFKLCTKPYTFPPNRPGGKSVEIEPGTPIAIPVYGLHMDPELYPNPDEFHPERFKDEDKLDKYTYLPFGEGPRNCIGMRMAKNQIKVGIINIVKNFEIRLAPQMQNKPLVMAPSSFIYVPVGGLWITLHDLDEKKLF